MKVRAIEAGRGNDGLWKGGKTMRLFPHLPTALGNRCGDYHISTATTTTGMDEYPSKPAR